MNPSPSPLAAKLAKILGDIGTVPKSGHNSFHNYDYVTENDLVYAVRGRLAEAGIFIFSSVEKQDVQFVVDDSDPARVKRSVLTTVCMKHTMVDGESGDSFSVLSQGQGSDVGDKGGYKATTGAMKYFLYKCFMISTGDDPEADERTDHRGAGTQERPATQERRASPPEERRAAPAGGGGAISTDEVKRMASEGRASVPRDNTTDELDQFRKGGWQDVKIHFGTNYKNMKLGDLSPQQLRAWFNWQPKPFKGKISEEDRILRCALTVADEESGQG